LVTKSKLGGSAYISKMGLSLQVTYGGTAFLYFPCTAAFNMSPHRALNALENGVREAMRQSRLAYAYCPNSYTHGSLNACLAVENALEVIRAHLSEDMVCRN
jgi:hypothetical protein